MKDDRKSQTRSSTCFLITLNQPERFDDLRFYIESLIGLKYGVAAKEEAPTTGKKHIHMFVQFGRSIRLSIKKLEGAHVDKCFGSPQQNKDYVTKGGDVIWERGEIKRKGGVSIEEVEKMTIEQRKKLPLIYYKSVRDLDAADECTLTADTMSKNVKVYYISGRSGIGKTTFAKCLIGKKPFSLVKYENGFWTGLNNTEAALYDDWRDTHMKASEFINFIDYNKQVMNVKHSFKLNTYSLIVITSVLRLEDIYKDADFEYREQWTRRVKEIKMSVVYNDDRKKWLTFMIKALSKFFKLIIYKKLKLFNFK